jgi:hypothetical protein
VLVFWSCQAQNPRGCRPGSDCKVTLLHACKVMCLTWHLRITYRVSGSRTVSHMSRPRLQPALRTHSALVFQCSSWPAVASTWQFISMSIAELYVSVPATSTQHQPPAHTNFCITSCAVRGCSHAHASHQLSLYPCSLGLQTMRLIKC